MRDFLAEKIKLIARKKTPVKCVSNLLTAEVCRLLGLSASSRYPISLNIEPTNLCNLHCPMCPTGSGRLKRKKGIMSFDLFKKIIDETGDYLSSLILFGYGEPFLSPDLIKMIRYAVNKKIWVWTSTNGHFFKDEAFIEQLINSGLHHILICLDGLSEESVSRFRKGIDYTHLIKNLKKLGDMKRSLNVKYPYLELQFIEMKHNRHELPKVKSFARQIGCDRFSIKNVGISLGYPDFEKLAEKYLPQGLEQTDYLKKDKNGKYGFVHDPRVSCKWLYNTAFINWDGTVVPCCYDLFGEHVLGDVSKESMKEIWNNAGYRKLRVLTRQSRNNVDICRFCPEDRRKRYRDIALLKKGRNISERPS